MYLRFLLCLIIGFCQVSTVVNAQKINKYGLKIIENPQYYSQEVANNKSLELTELKTLIPDLLYDLRYATKNNFTGKRLYPSGTSSAFLRSEAANALKLVAEDLRKQGYYLKIYDAYRPYSVTEKFWKLIGDERYVAHPRGGSGHNRGLAVDLTLVSVATGKEIEMGTGYDDFNEIAWHGAEGISENAKANREVLKNAMLQHGFRLFETEWWHYSWPNTNNLYDVMDIPFRKIPVNKEY